MLVLVVVVVVVVVLKGLILLLSKVNNKKYANLYNSVLNLLFYMSDFLFQGAPTQTVNILAASSAVDNQDRQNRSVN